MLLTSHLYIFLGVRVDVWMLSTSLDNAFNRQYRFLCICKRCLSYICMFLHMIFYLSPIYIKKNVCLFVMHSVPVIATVTKLSMILP
jgi:hypothetical protein